MDYARSSYWDAIADWQCEVDEAAADLLRKGQALNPTAARMAAECIVQERRRKAAQEGEPLAKVFSGAGPMQGQA